MTMQNGHHRLNGLILVAASLAVVASTFIPYALLNSNPPSGMTFSGMSTNIPDESSYLMWSRQHARGQLMVQNHMTTQPHDSILPNPAWLCVGLVSAATGTDGIIAYHIARAVISFLYLLLLWSLLKSVTGTNVRTWVAWALIAAGGGLGWVELTGWKIPSADWITELWSWPSMLHYPHFALSLLLTVATLRLWLLAANRGSKPLAAGAGLCLGLLALTHPYTALTLAAAAFLFFGFHRYRMTKDPSLSSKPVAPLPLVALAALPGFAAIAIQTRLNPMVAAWAQQNLMPSPPVWEYALGLGLAGLAAAAMTIKVCRNRKAMSPVSVFLIIWIATAFILAYADPIVPFARRCIEGMHIAVVLLAVEFVFSLKRRWKVAATTLILATALPTPAAHILREIKPDNPGYVPADQDEMLSAVRKFVKDGHIFADPRNSLFIAAGTDASVFVGHHEVSPDFVRKMQAVERMMTTRMTWIERLDILEQANCRWIVTDPWTADNLLFDAEFRGQTARIDLREYSRGKSWVLIGPGLTNQ